jgi:hypothetical protein
VLSVLRYLFILHSDWVHKRFPDLRILTAASLLLIYLQSSAPIITVLVVATSNGWPYIEVVEMKMGPRLLCNASILGSYLVFFGASTFFYFLILRNRTRMGQNSVGGMELDNLDNIFDQVRIFGKKTQTSNNI